MSSFQIAQPLQNRLYEALHTEGEAALPLMRRVRRRMHAHPELSMHEQQTTRFLADTLRDLGFEPHVTDGQIGLTFEWSTAEAEQASKRVGLRGDIDALPIQTASTADYASRVEGVMHACGHDAHAAVVVGAATILKSLHEQKLLDQPVAIRGILQPAEETSEGAPYMLERGAAEGLLAALAVHVDPTLGSGCVASRSGPFTAGCDTFDVVFRGRSGHSARPHQARDALQAASAWVQQAYARLPRVYDCRDPAVFTVGTFQAGVASNVIADSAKLTGTLRTVSDPIRRQMMDALNAVSTAIEAEHGVQVSFEVTTFTPSLHNQPELTQAAMNTARKLLGESAVESIPLPSMGAEDFAFFCHHVPCCMLRLGTAGHRPTSANEFSSPLHSPGFDIDESALATGAKVLAACTIELFKSGLQLD